MNFLGTETGKQHFEICLLQFDQKVKCSECSTEFFYANIKPDHINCSKRICQDCLILSSLKGENNYCSCNINIIYDTQKNLHTCKLCQTTTLMINFLPVKATADRILACK